jgi:RND family efflux transporter MFP subunit
MKKNQVIGILMLLLFACNNKKEDKNLNEMLKKRDELSKQIEDKNTELNKLIDEIAKIQKIDNHQVIVPHTIVYQPFQHTIDLESTISTDMNVMIYPEFAGSLTWSVKEGQRVSKGQQIASINDGGMSSQLKQVEIQADLAKTSFEKQSRLWNEKIGSEMQYLQAKSASEGAFKQVAAMKAQMSRTKVLAPFSGTIDQRLMQTGQVVAPGVPIAKIINLDDMKVTADVSEKYINKVKAGTKVNVDLPDIAQKIQGSISRISSSINPSNRTFSIEIPITNKNGLLKPNMSAKISIIDYSKPNAIVVPNSAINTNANGDKYVYTLTNINGKDAVASKSMVTLGTANTDFTEVLFGLKAGDIVIVDGSKTVVDKSSVKF